jgi:hypothetical protein
MATLLTWDLNKFTAINLNFIIVLSTSKSSFRIVANPFITLK